MSGTTTSNSALGATTGATTSSAPGSASGVAADDIEFAVFYGDNAAAVHLLEIVQLTSSPPAVRKERETIAYHLSVPASYSGGLERFKWRIGAGTSRKLMEKKLSSVEPEILLSPPLGSPSASLARKDIKDYHASISFHPHSGALIFETRASGDVVYRMGMNGRDLEIKKKIGHDPNRLCALWQKKNYLRFGEYWFVLEFCVKDEDASRFQEFQDRNLKRRYCSLPPSKLLDFVPGTDPMTRKSGQIWLQQRIPNTNLRAGVDICSGQPLVVGKFSNDDGTRQYINSRFRLARLAQREDKHVNSRLMLTDVWCENDACSSRHLHEQLEVCDCPRIYYAMPLTANNFRDVSWDDISAHDRLGYLYQTLQGLAELHQQHLAHGCILPDSLVFRDSVLPSSEGKRGLLKGAGLSLSLQLDKFHESICAAPEIWDDQADLDQTKMDIWALAASWLFAYIDPPDKVRIREHDFGIHTSLDDLLKEGIVSKSIFLLFRRMLSWRPEERPSAKEALADKAWESIREQEELKNAQKKRRRKQEIQQHQSRVGEPKKAKVVSPYND